MTKTNYDAFISYKHEELDSYAANELHKMLEHFKIPRRIQKTSGKKKINRIFRDREELALSSDLNENIQYALTHSEYLIVICSPETRNSKWVQKEIELFKSCHSHRQILAVLVKGEPEEAFPESILFRTETYWDHGKEVTQKIPVEPLAADIRGDSKREIRKKMQQEILRLAAPILSCTYDELRQRRKEYEKRTTMAALSAIFSLATVFSVYAFHQSNEIKHQYQNSLKNQARYLSKISGELLSSGDREGALKTAMALSYTENGEELPYVPEQIYALNEALYSYQFTEEYRPFKMVKLDSSILDKGMADPRGTFYMDFKDNGRTAFFMSCTTGDILWEVTASELTKGKDYTFIDGTITDNGQVILFTSQYLLFLDEESQTVSDIAELDDDCIYYTYAASEQYVVIAYEIYDDTCVQIYDFHKKSWVFDSEDMPVRKAISEISSQSNVFLRSVMIDSSGNTFLLHIENPEETIIVQYDLITGKEKQVLHLDPHIIRCNSMVDHQGNLVLLHYFYGHQSCIDGTYISIYNLEKQEWISKDTIYLSTTLDSSFCGIRFFDMQYNEKEQNVLIVWIGRTAIVANVRTGDIIYRIDLPEDITTIYQADSQTMLFALSNGSIRYYNPEAIAHEYRMITTQLTENTIRNFYYCPQSNTMLQLPTDSDSNSLIILHKMADEDFIDTKYQNKYPDLIDSIVCWNDDKPDVYLIGCVFEKIDDETFEETYIIWEGEISEEKEICQFKLPASRRAENIQIQQNQNQVLLSYNEVDIDFNNNSYEINTDSCSYGYHLIDLYQQKELFCTSGHESRNRYTTSNDGTFAAVYTHEQFSIISCPDGKTLLPPENDVKNTFSSEHMAIRNIQISGDDQYLILELYEPNSENTVFYIKIWDILNQKWQTIDNQETLKITTYESEMTVFYAEEKPLIAVPSEDGTLQVYDLEKGISDLSIKHPMSVYQNAAFYNHDQQLIVADHETKTLSIWDIEHKKRLSQFKYDFDASEIAAGYNSLFYVKEESSPMNHYLLLSTDENNQIFKYAEIDCGKLDLYSEVVLNGLLTANFTEYDYFYSFGELKDKAEKIAGSSLTEEEKDMYFLQDDSNLK